MIGAGMAGLCAARVLQETGFEVLLIEARDRVGGRIWTRLLDGVPCDAGASWIHGLWGNPLTAWCRRLEIPILKVPKGAPLFFWCEKRSSLRHLLWAARRAAVLLVLERVKQGLKHLSESLIRSTSPPDPTSLQQLFETVAQRLPCHPGDQALLCSLLAFLEAVNGAPAEDIAASEWTLGDGLGGNGIPQGGFGRLVEDLSQGLDIRLETPIETLAYGP
ncbi:MAG: FAD-dependent oxidoreductase, partial [Deltaproteobacteria bacterium]|nr:FAD-dependent oxidoreductase [Deltaproteobacteria bacterium]